MSTDRRKSYEAFRFITPILVTISLFILGAIWKNMDDISKSVDSLKIDVAVLKEKTSRGR